MAQSASDFDILEQFKGIFDDDNEALNEKELDKNDEQSSQSKQSGKTVIKCGANRNTNHSQYIDPNPSNLGNQPEDLGKPNNENGLQNTSSTTKEILVATVNCLKGQTTDMNMPTPTKSITSSSPIIVGSKESVSDRAPYMMSGANPDAESHLEDPLMVEDDRTVCTFDDETIQKHMPNALLPVYSFAHHFSPKFDLFHHFGRFGFFTTVRGLIRSLEIVQEAHIQSASQRDWLLYNEIGSRGGTIPRGKGEHAMALEAFFEDNDCDQEFWEEIDKEWNEGPWAEWPVDEWGRDCVPDPKRD